MYERNAEGCAWLEKVRFKNIFKKLTAFLNRRAFFVQNTQARLVR